MYRFWLGTSVGSRTLIFVYAILAVLGAVIPLSQLIPWLLENGLDIPLLIREAFGSNLSAFAWFDVVVSAFVLLIFIFWEGRRLKMEKLWLPALGTCAIGVSVGLPLFLMMRERKQKLIATH